MIAKKSYAYPRIGAIPIMPLMHNQRHDIFLFRSSLQMNSERNQVSVKPPPPCIQSHNMKQCSHKLIHKEKTEILSVLSVASRNEAPMPPASLITPAALSRSTSGSVVSMTCLPPRSKPSVTSPCSSSKHPGSCLLLLWPAWPRNWRVPSP